LFFTLAAPDILDTTKVAWCRISLSGSRENYAKRLGYTALSRSHRQVTSSFSLEKTAIASIFAMRKYSGIRMLPIAAQPRTAKKITDETSVLFCFF